MIESIKSSPDVLHSYEYWDQWKNVCIAVNNFQHVTYLFHTVFSWHERSPIILFSYKNIVVILAKKMQKA